MRNWKVNIAMTIDGLKKPRETLDETIMTAAKEELHIVDGRILHVHVRPQPDSWEYSDSFGTVVLIIAVGCSQ